MTLGFRNHFKQTYIIFSEIYYFNKNYKLQVTPHSTQGIRSGHGRDKGGFKK